MKNVVIAPKHTILLKIRNAFKIFTYILAFIPCLGLSQSLYAQEFFWIIPSAQFNTDRFPSPEAACTAVAGPFPLVAVVPNPEPNRDDFLCDRLIETSTGVFFIQRFANTLLRGDTCPTPDSFYDRNLGICRPSNLNKNSGDPVCTGVGNPINIVTGNKYQRESDYIGSGRFPLEVNRSYNSDSGDWRFLPQIISSSNRGPVNVLLIREDGKALPFRSDNEDNIVSDPDVTSLLERFADTTDEIFSWRFTSDDQTTETYNRSGQLISVTNREGVSHTYEYTANNINVTHTDGQVLTYILGEGRRIIGFTTPDGEEYFYDYDTEDRLSVITYPDSTPSDVNDNPQRIYHYEDTSFPSALTGITDETGIRFATWAYDTQGRAISSEHAEGVERFTVDYTYLDDAIGPRVTVTNPLNKQTTYHFETINGRRLTTLIEGHATLNCPDTDRSNTYDANGFRDLAVDWNGTLTDFDHDERGLEIQRIEAVGTPEQKTITTTWHPDFRLPIEIVEPNKTTTFTYDTNGNLLSRTETDTGATP